MRVSKSHFFIILFLIFSFSNGFESICYSSSKNVQIIKNNLKNAEITEPFSIYGNQGWLDLKNEGNCTGEGTYSDPYIIEDLIINGDGISRIIEIWDSTVYFIIRNCTLLNATVSGIYCNNVSRGVFTNNTISNCDLYGIYFYINCNNNTIINNIIENNDRGIYLSSYSFQNKIYFNNISRSRDEGIDLFTSNGNEIIGNVINNTGETGLYISSDSRNNTISYNCIMNSSYDGIYLNGPRNNTFSHNYIHNNKRNGIYTRSVIDEGFNLFENNIICNNSEDGILVETTANNFTRNIIRDNRLHGIYVRNVSNNLIYNNTFGNECYDRYGLSNWNNSEIGNYWDFYNGKDENDDGIGDTAQLVCRAIIDEYIYDYLPIWRDGPNITILTPNNNSIFTSNLEPPYYSLNITDPNLDKIWYILDSEGETHFTEDNSTIDYESWINLENGNITLKFYANDTFGYVNSNQINIIKDCPLPVLLISEPIEGFVIGNIAPNYNVTMTELPLNKIWYTLNDGITNYTIYNIFSNNITGKINQSAWDYFQDTLVTLKIYGEDITGRECHNAVNIYKDVAAPIININSPIFNSSYSEDAPSFDLTIIEGNLIATWYTVNGEHLTNFSNPKGIINQVIWNTLPEGQVQIIFYAKDIAGNIVYQEVSVNKTPTQSTEPSPPNPQAIPGYSQFVLLGVMCIVSILLIRKENKS